MTERSRTNPTSSALTSQRTALLRIGRDSLIYLPTVIVPAIAGIVTIRLLTTFFSQQEYGWYNVALSTIGLLKVLGGVWLGTSAARFFLRSRLDKRDDYFLSTLFYTSLGSSAVVAILALIVVHLFGRTEYARGILHLAIVAALLSTLFEVLVVVFRAGLQPQKYARYWIAYTTLKPTVGILLILVSSLRVQGILLGFVASPLFLLFLLARDLNLWPAVRRRLYDRQLLSTYVHFGLPLAVTNLATWLLSLSDRYIIQAYRGSAEVGLYSVGYAVPEKTLQFAFMALMLATYPILIDTFENQGQDATQTLLARVTRLCLLLCTPILALLFAVPKELVLLLADAKFSAGSRVVPFVATGLFFFGLNQLASKGFELHRKSIYIAAIAVFSGVLNLTMNILLVPRVGFIGAAFSACISYLTLLLITTVKVRRFMPWQVSLLSILRLGLAATLSVVSVHIVSLILGTSITILLIKVPAALLFFYAVLFLTKEIRTEDVLLVRSLAKTLVGQFR